MNTTKAIACKYGGSPNAECGHTKGCEGSPDFRTGVVIDPKQQKWTIVELLHRCHHDLTVAGIEPETRGLIDTALADLTKHRSRVVHSAMPCYAESDALRLLGFYDGIGPVPVIY